MEHSGALFDIDDAENRVVISHLSSTATLPNRRRRKITHTRAVLCRASTKCNFLVLFPRNVERHRVGFENRRDLGEFLTGGWCHKSSSMSQRSLVINTCTPPRAGARPGIPSSCLRYFSISSCLATP